MILPGGLHPRGTATAIARLDYPVDQTRNAPRGDDAAQLTGTVVLTTNFILRRVT